MHLVVIGNGIAGVTCARHVRKLDPAARITLVSDESDHPYSRTALMYVYMGHLTVGHTKLYEDRFWRENRIGLLRDRVERVDPEARRLYLRDGAPLTYDRLLIACGSRPRLAGWPGQDLAGVQGLYGLGDLERMERDTAGVERAVVVGGGLIGVEMAEMLRTRGIGVTVLVREAGYFGSVLPAEESALVGREIRRHGVDLRLGTELKAILPDAHGRVRAVVTTAGEEIPAGFVGLTIGVEPNVDFLRGSDIEVGRGVLVDRRFETSVPGVFAAGDCAEFREPLPERKRVEQLWYTGRLHGATVAHTVCGRPRAYDPGVFFNSAKFFDVEYQTYGRIPPTLRAGEETLYWEHPDGRRSIRITYERVAVHGRGPADTRVVGFNLLGVRYRQAVCARWIERGTSLEHVLEHLGEANFDPEFFPQFERSVVAAYNERHPGRPLRLRRRRGWRRWMAPNALTGADILPGTPLP
ncbi:MAG: FAD/NAD(P)-binding oxidoreductase [Rhodothermales bacterium]|nr:FAD/NAD(P)-binding oxidoreductase [Rhodothermales bacterium]